MRTRPGVTLIEVLVAIFVMAIGLLALLTLFPLGALRMSQALQADRTAACATEASNYCDGFGMRADPQAIPNNWFTQPAPPNSNNYPPASPTGGNFPVYVDPYWVAVDGTPPTPLGLFPSPNGVAPNPPTPGIRRVSPSGIPGLTAPLAIANRYFTLLDDMTFLNNGTPAGNGTLKRADRYTWALLLHRLSPYSNQDTTLTVVVYAGRTTALAGGEATYAANGNYQETAVALSFAGTQPDIRRGTWILDTSYDPATSSVHGDFYRVVSVSVDPSNPNQLDLELQNPLGRRIGNTNQGINAITVMDNVVEVFERGVGQSNEWEFVQKNY